MADSSRLSNILVVGSGGVGTIMAYNLQLSGKAIVSCVLRSNYDAVKANGFDIDSCDYGRIKGWRPSMIYSSASSAVESQPYRPYDFIVVATKNVPDVPPSLRSILAPVVTPSHTVIVLAQNGLNIERSIIAAFPQNAVLSVIVLMGAHEKDAGTIVQDDKDIMRIGAFQNPNISPAMEKTAVEKFVELYRAAGVAKCEVNVGEAVQYERWRKLVYNSSFNPICAITGMDTSRLRYAGRAIEDLVRPAMEEIRATAKAKGFEIPAELVQGAIDIDPIEAFLKPSMMTDVEKGNYIEHENILGEPLREAEGLGVSTPTLKVLYGLCRAFQWRTMESRGLVVLPGKKAS